MPDNPLMTHTELINVTKTGEENIMSMSRQGMVIDLAHKMVCNDICWSSWFHAIDDGNTTVVELHDGEIFLTNWKDTCLNLAFDPTVKCTYSPKLAKEALGVVERWEMIPDVIEDFSGPGGCYGPRKINEDDPEY